MAITEEKIAVTQLFKEIGFISANQLKRVYSLLSNSSDFTHIDFQLDFFGTSIKGHTSNLIDRHLYFLGSYELSILQEIKNVLSQKKTPIFIDVGSNIGLHSFYASKFAGHVYGFEPFQLVRDRSLEVIRINKITNVTIFPFALGEKDDELYFKEPPLDNLGLGSFDHSSVLDLKIPVKNGDYFFKEQGIESVDLIKIDTEGYETFVLDGLLETIERCRPTLILEYSEKTHHHLQRNLRLRDFLKETYQSFVFPFPNSDSSPILPWDFDFFGNIILRAKV